MTADQLN